ncbi:MAG: SulP family inorganic anion transporter [Alphaproteobacteria bacterium]
MTLIHGLRFDNLRGDIYGGLTAAVVALPLALAFGVASGAGPVAGLYGAIFVGFFAALFGGTPSQVSGPTGPMTVVMAGVITQYSHEPAMAFTVVMLAGVFQIMFGLFKLGRYISLVPFPVISGFMSGIGCIIIILQIGPLIGHATPSGGTLVVLSKLPDLLTSPGRDAMIVGLLALGLVYLIPVRISRIVPAPLVALVLGTVAVLFLLPDAPVLGEIPTGWPKAQLPVFTLETVPGIVQSALVLALLGSIDSLLTSLIADNVTQTYHDSDRELIGQGIGNTIAGAFGGIPGAGATMRTVINVRTGGRTPISGALHALVLLAVVLGLGGLAQHIPHAVLAGILIKVGIDIIDWSYLKRIRQAPKAGVFFMLVVLLLTVLVDLITAVAVGIVLASLLFVKRMSDLQLANIKAITGDDDDPGLTEAEKSALAAGDGRIILYHLSGPFSFGAAKGMARLLAASDDYDALVLDLSDVPFLDSSASLGLEDAIKQAHGHDKQVYLVGVRAKVMTTLNQLGVLKLLPESHHHVSRLEALEQAAAAIK